jgi:hypothetical protein
VCKWCWFGNRWSNWLGGISLPRCLFHVPWLSNRFHKVFGAVGDKVVLDFILQSSNEATDKVGLCEASVVHLHQGHHIFEIFNIVSN